MGSDLERHDPNRNRPPAVDPSHAIERVGRQSAGHDSSGAHSAQSDHTPSGLSGLDFLYGKGATEFVFEGETYRLLRAGHHGQVAGNFLTATHLRPHNTPIGSARDYWRKMGELYNGGENSTNNFFLMGVAFLNREPTKEVGLSIKRAMVSELLENLKKRRNIYGVSSLLENMDMHAIFLGSSVDRYLNDTFGVQAEDQSRRKRGLAGFFGAKTQPRINAKQYDRTQNPSIVGAELRFYYGEGSQGGALTQGKTPAANPVSRDIVVLSGGDLAI